MCVTGVCFRCLIIRKNLKGKFVSRLSWKYLMPMFVHIIDSNRRWDGQSFQLSHSTKPISFFED